MSKQKAKTQKQIAIGYLIPAGCAEHLKKSIVLTSSPHDGQGLPRVGKVASPR